MVKQKILQDIKEVIKDLGYSAIDPVCYINKNPAFGDYTTNVALQLSKLAQGVNKQSPQEIANQLVAKLNKLQSARQYLEKVEVAGAGFINLFVKPQAFKEGLSEIEEGFGCGSGGANQKVVLEHTSVNPNKTMHIGHLRNAVIGDVLARILARSSFRVEVQNYIDDTGVQVADTYVGVKYRKELGFRQKKEDEPLDEYYWDLYAAVTQKYEEDPNFLVHRTDTLKQLEDQSSDTSLEVKNLAVEVTKSFENTLARFGIYHDLLVWESDILKRGFWEKAFETLKKTPGFEKEEEGKYKGTWLVRIGEKREEDEDHLLDKIFVRSDGTTTYIAKDFAYNLWKFGLLGKDFLYKVWGPKPGGNIYTTDAQGQEMEKFGHGDLIFTVIDQRQSYLYKVIKEVFTRLGYDSKSNSLKHVAYGVVTLSANTAKALGAIQEQEKRAYAMSGRKGIGVKVWDLHSLLVHQLLKEKPEKIGEGREGGALSAEEIAIGAIKYYMLKFNSETEIVFDFDQALSLYGATGPYLQYTSARASGILEKVREKGKDGEYSPNRSELELIRKMLEWPDVTREVSQNLETSVVATFAFELAQLFNTFYEKNPVMGATGVGERFFRLTLVEKFKLVYGDVLDTLGIKAAEKM